MFQKGIWIKINRKNFTTPFNPVFFILLIVKSFEKLPKRSGQSFISEFYALNLYTFVALANKKLLFPL